jgi:hypothetical protein
MESKETNKTTKKIFIVRGVTPCLGYLPRVPFFIIFG